MADYKKLTFKEALRKYVKVRKTINDLEAVRRELEQVVIDGMEYGDEPVYFEDTRIIKTMRENWSFPEWVENRRKEANAYMSKMRKSMKRVEQESIQAGEATKEEVYGLQFSVKGGSGVSK